VKLTLETKRDVLLLGIVLVAAVVIALLTYVVLPPPRAGSVRAQPSTFFNEPYGTKAAYLTLEKLGFDVARLRRPIDTDTLEGLDGLVLLRPVVCLNENEDRVLRAWVRQGHVLLVSPGVDPPDTGGGCAGPHDWFNYTRIAPTAGSSGGQGLATTSFSEADKASFLLLEGIGVLRARTDLRFDPERPTEWPTDDSPARVIWKDEFGAVAAEVTHGRGRILCLADVYALSNEGLGEGDHAVWLANLAMALTGDDPGARLAFDEYHAGFPYCQHSWIAVVHLLWDRRWGWSVGQGLAVAVLALLAAGVRFGRPHGVRRTPRRTQGEFTAAAGRLLHAARASDVALETLLGHYRSRICQVLQLSPHCVDSELADTLQRRGQATISELLSRAAARQTTGALSSANLLQLTQRLHTAVEALEHGTGSRITARPERPR